MPNKRLCVFISPKHYRLYSCLVVNLDDLVLKKIEITSQTWSKFQFDQLFKQVKFLRKNDSW